MLGWFHACALLPECRGGMHKTGHGKAKSPMADPLPPPWPPPPALLLPSVCPQVHGLKEACAAVRAAGRRLVVAAPRVLKPGEEALLRFYLRLGADALLLRSAGALQQLMDLGGPGE